MYRLTKIIKRGSLLFYLCFLFSCGSDLQLKPPIFKEDFDQAMHKIIETGGFSDVDFTESAKQRNNDKPYFELELKLINGQNLPVTERGLDSLAKNAAIILKNSIENIHDYDYIFVLFDAPALAKIKKKTFGYHTTELK